MYCFRFWNRSLIGNASQSFWMFALSLIDSVFWCTIQFNSIKCLKCTRLGLASSEGFTTNCNFVAYQRIWLFFVCQTWSDVGSSGVSAQRQTRGKCLTFKSWLDIRWQIATIHWHDTVQTCRKTVQTIDLNFICLELVLRRKWCQMRRKLVLNLFCFSLTVNESISNGSIVVHLKSQSIYSSQSISNFCWSGGPTGVRLKHVMSILLIGLLVALTLVVLWRRRHLYKLSWQLPGPFAYPILGNLMSLWNEDGKWNRWWGDNWGHPVDQSEQSIGTGCLLDANSIESQTDTLHSFQKMFSIWTN